MSGNEQLTQTEQQSIRQVLPVGYLKMRPASEINEAMKALPVAEEIDLFLGWHEEGRHEKVPNYKAIGIMTADGMKCERVVNCPGINYKLVQHKDAFAPVIDGLKNVGVGDYRFLTKNDWGVAQLEVYATKAGYDTVSLGFKVCNSIDGTRSIDFGFHVGREQRVIEIVGYRQVCSNGMKIRVPLDQAEFVKPEVRTQMLELLRVNKKIRHTASADDRLQAVRAAVETIGLLQDPVEKIIKKAEKWNFDDYGQLKYIVEKYVRKNIQKRVLDQMSKEDMTLWGLYNAITWIASHDEKFNLGQQERIIDSAATMLEAEIFA